MMSAAGRSIIRDVRELKESSPCMDCGKYYSYWIMQYDHRDSSKKTAGINTLIWKSSRQRVMEEIELCDLVCANCHSDRTYLRSNGLM